MQSALPTELPVRAPGPFDQAGARALRWGLRTLLCGLFLGCASVPPSPFFNDEQYLRFGLEPEAEAKALIEEYRSHGYELARQLSGQHFEALGFARGKRPSVVRIITTRGIVVAHDPQPNLVGRASEHYELLPPPLRETHDADGDGFEEVFVLHESEAGPCLLVHRVRDVGFVDPVPVTLELFGERFCPSDVADLNGDGRAELIAEIVVPGFGDAYPTVRVPLWAKDHRFRVDADPVALAQHVQAERTTRNLELGEARRVQDVPWAFRLALELSALAHLEGRQGTEVAQVFDAALAGLSLDPTYAARVLEARERIAAWQDTEPEPEPAAAPDANEASTPQAPSGVTPSPSPSEAGKNAAP